MAKPLMILGKALLALFLLLLVAWPLALATLSTDALAQSPQAPQAPGTPEELQMISHECRNGRVVSLRVAVPVPGVLQIDLDHSVLCKGRGEA